MHAPFIHAHGIKLGSHSRLEDQFAHRFRNAFTIIDQSQGSNIAATGRGKKQIMRMGVACIPQKLYDGVFDASNILFSLPALRFGNP